MLNHWNCGMIVNLIVWVSYGLNYRFFSNILSWKLSQNHDFNFGHQWWIKIGTTRAIVAGYLYQQLGFGPERNDKNHDQHS